VSLTSAAIERYAWKPIKKKERKKGRKEGRKKEDKGTYLYLLTMISLCSESAL
jgi:hypothetical protein